MQIKFSSFSKYFLMSICLSFLFGCTTHISNERLHQTSAKKFNAIETRYVQNEPRGVATFVVDRSQAYSKVPLKVPEKVRQLALQDSAEIMSLAKEGLETYLKPMLQLKNVQVPPRPAQAESAGILLIKPVLYTVECGALAVICQASVLFEVDLIDREFSRTEWSAKFKVGAPMAAKQDQKVAESFFSSMVDKLVAAKLIGK